MNKRHLFLLILLSFFVTAIWFKDGRLLATAEEGMIFYSPQRTLKVYSDVWQRNGTGQIASFMLPTVPTMIIPAIFEFILPTNIIQALFYFFIFLSALIGMYLFTLKLTNKNEIALIASLFYIFNLFTILQIFARALSPGMLLWAYLPLFFYLLTSWLETGKLRNFFILILSTVLFAYIFVAPAAILTFSFFTVAVYIYLFLKYKNKRKTLVKRFGLFCLAFVFLHSFWLYPYVTLAKQFPSADLDPNFSLNSLRGVSAHFPTSQILTLRQTFYFENPWYGWYKEGWAVVLSLLILLFVTVGIFAFKRNINWKFLFFLLLAGWFVAKGTNPPLGEAFYSFLFSKIPRTVVMRNPYEKFGLIFLLPYSVFFAAGVNRFFGKKRISFYTALFLTIGILGSPIWTGKVFEDYVWVKVPQYYSDANKFLNERIGDSRILVLPPVPYHSATFTWGYRGLEPSIFLFDKPTVSRELAMASFFDEYKKLLETINEGESLENLLEDMDVKYIVVRHDLRWDFEGASSPDKVNSVINKTKNLSKVAIFGELDLYEFKSASSLFEVTDKQVMFFYQRLGNGRYIVKVKNAKQPFDLVFKETYHPLWQAKISDKILDQHYEIYGYANAWRVDKEGDFEINLALKVWPWD